MAILTWKSRYLSMIVLATIALIQVHERSISPDAFLIVMSVVAGFSMLTRTIIEFSK